MLKKEVREEKAMSDWLTLWHVNRMHQRESTSVGSLSTWVRRQSVGFLSREVARTAHPEESVQDSPPGTVCPEKMLRVRAARLDNLDREVAGLRQYAYWPILPSYCVLTDPFVISHIGGNTYMSSLTQAPVRIRQPVSPVVKWLFGVMWLTDQLRDVRSMVCMITCICYSCLHKNFVGRDKK